MSCTKPNCNCVEREAERTGVPADQLKRGYPCLAPSEDMGMKKKQPANMDNTNPPLNEIQERLLPCPLCGGPALFAGYISAGNYEVRCVPCTLSIRQDRIDKVIDIWNTRATQN